MEPDETDNVVNSELHPLTNEDFRKLINTSVSRNESNSSEAKPRERFYDAKPDTMNERRKKKMHYAKLKKLEEEREKELREKYRDRAAERRKEFEKDEKDDDVEDNSTTADYKAVAPGAESAANFSEWRNETIKKSKYLGGDMEHTHLVKGLDYALLEKVRNEICSKEHEEIVLEDTLKETENRNVETLSGLDSCTGALAKGVYRAIFMNRRKNRNALFMNRRMAYSIDLEGDYTETDIPTTVIRSKADCMVAQEPTSFNTNEIVISKLTEILSYLRQGKREKRRLKKEKGKSRDEAPDKKNMQDESIYSGLGKYEPSIGIVHKNSKSRDGKRDRRWDRDEDGSWKEKNGSYFDHQQDEDLPPPSAENAKQFIQKINQRFSSQISSQQTEDSEDPQLSKLKRKMQISSYAECYPGFMETEDALDDSDEEADFSKMDLGNKKGPVSRWDFETNEEYSSYMDNREALPKAAFQYGVKMSDGRRTRRFGPKDEKKELDREWQKIQNILSKRKSSDGKRPKY